MAIVKGGEIMLFVSTTDGTGYKSIAQATNHTLTISADTIDISTKDIHAGKWTAADVNMLSWTCSSENLVCDDPQGVSYEDLVEMMINKQEIYGVFGQYGNKTAGTDSTTGDVNVPEGGWIPTNNDTKKDGLKGKMVITNLVKNAPNGDNASFTVDFTGVGPLERLAPKGNNSSVLSTKTAIATVPATK